MPRKRLIVPPARFSVSLHPEIFFALQVLSEPGADKRSRWRAESLRRFPLDRWAVQLPGALWTAVPDVLDVGPTADFDGLASALERVDDRVFQERFLTGLLHYQSAAHSLLDKEESLQQVVASLPRVKREWLGHVGLYPIEPEVEDALARLIRSPESFRADILATLHAFWEATFAETWEALLPDIKASIEEKQRLFDRCTFQEFLRHTLLPIELVKNGGVLRALRGGYELPLSEVKEFIFTPSAFNESRFWTTYGDGAMQTPWFPYCEPDLVPYPDRADRGGAQQTPDVALVFRALGNATRFAMASLIGRYPRSAAELASLLSVSKPTISHHLHVLRSAGLVHETDHKDFVLISLNKEVLRGLSDLAVTRLLESREPLELSRSRRT